MRFRPQNSVRLWLALLVAMLATAASPVQGPPPQTAVDGQQSDELVQYRSSAGLLAVTLTAAAGKVRIGDLEVDGATFNGSYAGPVLRVRPGDLLRVRLVNQLAEPLNLHFHGIFTSPLGNSDNIHIAVQPATSFTYEVRIPPEQPPGLYWYHSHIHGISEQQVMHGLSGALVVEGAAPPGVAERLFVLKDMYFEDDTDNPEIDEELHGLVQSINGRLMTMQTMQPGETQIWRFSNQSANQIFHIALQGHRLRVLTKDSEVVVGERVEDVLDIMPAERFSVLVESGEPGNYPLISKGAMTGTGAARKHDRVLGQLTVAGDPVAAVAALPRRSAPADLREVKANASRMVAFTETKSLKVSEQLFFINSRTFDPTRVDIRVPLGNVEDWTIRNDTDDMHVFHIHQLAFQVTEVNGKPVDYTGRVDTVRVPERGQVKIRIPFTDPTIIGEFMFHCHVLKHEDRGMMAQVQVYDPRRNWLATRVQGLYVHVWFWLHGVPWKLCGLEDA